MKELAEHLKSERLKQGLTIEAVSEQTRLSIDMLRCLEEANYEQIGSPLLINSFIRSYCSAVGIDPIPLLQEQKARISSFDRQKKSIRQYGKLAKTLRYRKRPGMFAILLLGIAAMGVLYGGVLFHQWKARISDSLLMTKSIPQEETPLDLSEFINLPSAGGLGGKPHADDPAGIGTAADEGRQETKRHQSLYFSEAHGSSPPTHAFEENTVYRPGDVLPEDPPSASSVSGMHRIEMTANRKVLVKIRIDGDTEARSVLMKAGENRSWDAKETVSVELRDSAAAKVQWDGKPVDVSGKPGRPLRVRLPLSDTGNQVKKKTR